MRGRPSYREQLLSSGIEWVIDQPKRETAEDRFFAMISTKAEKALKPADHRKHPKQRA
jgi:hypothetical protein